MIYNYRIGSVADSLILQEVCDFCQKKHTANEIIHHCQMTLDKLFMFHESSLFRKPINLEEDVWHSILSCYKRCMDDNDIQFPDRAEAKGPKYIQVEGLSQDEYNKDYYSIEYDINPDRRLTKFIPQFFGIKYSIKKQNKNTKDDNKFGWSSDAIPAQNMHEHRKLYDILYSLCYPQGRKPGEEKEKSNILGNLAKKSLFRFDLYANSEYRTAFDFINEELIYRLPVEYSWDKLRDSMYLAKVASERRNVALNLINQLVSPVFYVKFPASAPKNDNVSLDDLHKHYDAVYSHIIARCGSFESITIEESGKKDKYAFTINNDEKAYSAVPYYAYTYFANLRTADYFFELKEMFDEENDKLADTIRFSAAYIESRNKAVDTLYKRYGIQDPSKFLHTDFLAYASMADAVKIIYSAVFIDDFPQGEYKNFWAAHKDKIMSLIHLYRLLNRAEGTQIIDYRVFIDIIHLYIRLKKNAISIPTASAGYNKNNAAKTLKIDRGMDKLEEEWELRCNNQPVSDELYMRNRILETWLEAVMYMNINQLSPSLFVKRIKAQEILYYTLMQKKPAFSRVKAPDVDVNEIIETVLFAPKE